MRVHIFDGEWRLPLKRELCVAWNLDRIHHAEYSIESFDEEINNA